MSCRTPRLLTAVLWPDVPVPVFVSVADFTHQAALAGGAVELAGMIVNDVPLIVTTMSIGSAVRRSVTVTVAGLADASTLTAPSTAARCSAAAALPAARTTNAP